MNNKDVQEYHALELDLKRDGKGYDQNYQAALGELLRNEGLIVGELKNYESERQQTMELSVLNLIFNNIEYHGKAVERLSDIMNGFPDAEEGIQNVMQVNFSLVKICR